MIDFIKIKVINETPEIFLDNPALIFKQRVSKKTGELYKSQIAEYKGIKFIIHVSGVMIVEGSLRKFYNKGLNRFNDLNRHDLECAIKNLLIFMKVNQRNCTLINLKVGANVIPPIPTKELLNYLILHFRKEFKFGDINNGHYKQASYREYLIKAYDKAIQYNLPDELFRFELKFITSRKIRKFGINNIGDLMDKFKLQKVGNQLLITWQDLLMHDPTINVDRINLTIYEDRLKNWKNPNYWTSLANDKDAYRNKLSKEVKTYKVLQQFFSSNLQKQIAKQLYEKIISLLQLKPHSETTKKGI